MDLWHARHGGIRDEASAAADVYRTRTALWDAFHELELSTDNRALSQQAQRAIERASSIWQSDSKIEMDQRADQVRGDLAEVVTTARLSEPGRLPL
jgi:hypothetical protein